MNKLNQNMTGLQNILEAVNSIDTEVGAQTDLIEQITTALVDKTSVKTVSKYNIGVTVDSGATVTATNGEKSVTGVSSDRSCVLEVDSTGDWTVSAKIDGVDSNSRTINVSNNFFTELDFFAANITVSTSEGTVVTAVKGSSSYTQTAGSAGVVNFTIRDPGDWVFTATKNGKSLSETVSITVEQDYSLYLSVDLFDLNGNSWAKIREISDAGTGRNYWSVGDCKAVPLSGTMSTLALNTTLWVYILGFDHNKDVEGSGIQFGTFKTDSGSSGKDVCLIDSKYGSYVSNGTKYFNISHWGKYNYGGWARCDMRYDILGSTDVAPQGYGAKPASGQVGYAPSSTCATSPVANTLMSCFPAELRAVMKPITKWTNNVGNSGDTEEKVTAMVDYLPLLAEFEIFGTRKNANSYEQNHQAQYEYFSAGNSKVKYRHSATGSTAYWWERSPYYNNTSNFCFVTTGGSFATTETENPYGVAPVFMV
jgi:hypothetical protein